MMTSGDSEFRFRSIVVSAILPSMLFAIGEGAIIPIIPIAADNLGASLAIAGLIAAMITVGQVFGDIPSGWIIARIGERVAMMYATLLAIVGLAMAIAAPNPLILGVGIFVVGLATAVFTLARHAFMTTYVPRYFRARALSTLGGSQRFGYFVGPFITVGILHVFGSAQAVFWTHVVFTAAAGIMIFVLRDPTEYLAANTTEGGQRSGEAEVQAESLGLFRTIWSRKGVLLRLGVGSSIITAMRASRQVIIPLWAVSLGIPDTQVALIVGISGAIDFALFYASGQIMDRFGRLWSAVPALVGLSAGFLVLAFTHDLPSAVAWFLVGTFLMSVANGVGSGINMTLGADLADQGNPAPFLGAWRFTSDVGGAAAPLALAAITAAITIAFASGVMGVVGLIGAAMMLRYVPRYSPHVPRTKPGKA